jgi:hypothetical protein
MLLAGLVMLGVAAVVAVVVVARAIVGRRRVER